MHHFFKKPQPFFIHQNCFAGKSVEKSLSAHFDMIHIFVFSGEGEQQRNLLLALLYLFTVQCCLFACQYLTSSGLKCNEKQVFNKYIQKFTSACEYIFHRYFFLEFHCYSRCSSLSSRFWKMNVDFRLNLCIVLAA